MKLISFQVQTVLGSHTRIGAVVAPGGRVIDLQAAYNGYLRSIGVTGNAALRVSQAVVPTDMVSFIEGGEMSLDAARSAIEWAATDESNDNVTYQWDGIHRISPIPNPPLIRDFMGFEEHLLNIYPKLGREIPEQWYRMPVYYKGNPASIGTDGDIVYFPDYADYLDFEFELAAVIGQSGADFSPSAAKGAIYGYMIYNDFSARAIQTEEMAVGLGPAKGKDFVGGHVFGPYLVTADEIADPYGLAMVGRVNGETWCESNSSTMHWSFEEMIVHASRSEQLRVGEIFGSGTVGWGSAMERGEQLNSGDEVSLVVEKLGTLTNCVLERPDAIAEGVKR
jgi:2-keto-4-pentenoate hydratase/2-oxohepta-3-ene-1,7-dioic acid hydratase in catechol pathway